MRDPPRILVVDDVPDNLDILQMRLENQGYEVVTAGDGVEALEKVRELQPDLVLLDIMMPRMDGIEAVKRLKADTALPFIPVILVTARADAKDVVAGLASGGDDYRFTGFSETAEPEDVITVLREYHDALGPLIQESEGTLSRFTGDGLMVIFNDPLSCSDPARRAVRLAVAMRDVVASLARAWSSRGHAIGFGVGIAQGYATLGAIGFEGRSDYTAHGTVVNVSARLCAEAKDGQILVTQRVAAAIAEPANFEPLGDMVLKGIGRPLAVLNVTGRPISK